ncbi:hypothetical protein JZ751_003780 [Albula glossodonta]|uniref:Uncharacterized protein n=1 Tax=Albula glossodonta TaxID=121402 RepID=A0A8T2P5D2_9TELE|nr:hypothetical protein JZ751_003780 [Albula glossodonta]
MAICPQLSCPALSGLARYIMTDITDQPSYLCPTPHSPKPHCHPSPTSLSFPPAKNLLPEVNISDYGKNCVVIDLDETLVHSSFKALLLTDGVDGSSNERPDPAAEFTAGLGLLPAGWSSVPETNTITDTAPPVVLIKAYICLLSGWLKERERKTEGRERGREGERKGGGSCLCHWGPERERL